MYASDPAGHIEGITSTDSVTIAITTDRLGKNDYLEVVHEETTFLLMVKDVKRSGEKSIGTCIVVGKHPKTPFAPGASVQLASEETLRKGLGLETKEAEGIFLGKLKGTTLRVWLPIKKLTRVFVIGKPGAGKSFTMGVIAEELLKKGIPLVIIDAHGEYSSLKIPADMKDDSPIAPSSFSSQIIEFGEVAFNPGADIDISALEGTRSEDLICQMQCTIINLRGLALEQQQSIVARVLKQLLEAVMLMKIPPFYLALDEAHLFAGRSRVNEPSTRETLDIVKRFAQEGRKFGANLIVLTQRPQLLDMTVRSLSATWVIHQLTDPNDVRIAVESGGLGRDWENDINWLESGDAIVTGDIVERIPILLKVRPRETRHGAPGFNPLDFVSPEEREKMGKRMAALKERLLIMKVSAGKAPIISHTLPSLYLPLKVKEQDLLSILKEKRSLDAIDILKSELRYLPALFAEVTVNSERRKPDLVFKERLKRLVPADATMSSIDWRHESAYRMMAAEVLELSLSPDQPLDGKHEAISSVLSDLSGVESLKGTLRNYAISKLTQPIYYSKLLDEYSIPGESIDEFKGRVKAKLRKMKMVEVAGVKSKYAASMSIIKDRTKAAKDEFESKEKLIRSIKTELKSLEKDKAKAQKDGRSTLKVSSQIQLREERIVRLESRISELNEILSKARHEEEQLNTEMRHEISNLEKQAEKITADPVESMVFQPKTDEIEVQAFQLIWIPVISTTFRGVFGNLLADFQSEWNAVNGRGVHGNCSECGTSIESLDGDLYCYICAKIYCNDHLKTCSLCHRTVCKDHAIYCSDCGKPLCVKEHSIECAVCGVKLCTDCVFKCKDCSGKVYCKKHVQRCPVCTNEYCHEHQLSHTKYCERCGNALCALEQVQCKTCGRIYCNSDSVKCLVCGERVCREHAWFCSDCGRAFCHDEKGNTCEKCGAKLCNECMNHCSVCEKTICRVHTALCPDCSGKVCEACMVETRRLGIFKRAICKNCANK